MDFFFFFLQSSKELSPSPFKKLQRKQVRVIAPTSSDSRTGTLGNYESQVIKAAGQEVAVQFAPFQTVRETLSSRTRQKVCFSKPGLRFLNHSATKRDEDDPDKSLLYITTFLLESIIKGSPRQNRVLIGTTS